MGVLLQKGLTSQGKGQGALSTGIREVRSSGGACSDVLEWIPVETRQDRPRDGAELAQIMLGAF